VTIAFAGRLGIMLALLGLLLGYLVSYKIAVILSLYIALNLAYSLKLKNIVILDVFCISAGFMLRILSGTVGLGIPPSKWLLLCGMMITLFLGFAKRRAEILALTHHKEEHRQVLRHYGPIFLDELIGICATGVIISYSLYTMSADTIRIHQTENLIYTIPFVIYGLFRYLFLLHHTHQGGDPSNDLIKDPHIIVSVIGWALMTTYLN
jgi:4-hydroxybenzoate polyprenyltransferase